LSELTPVFIAADADGDNSSGSREPSKGRQYP
jgi:hypothetical protein